jgi:hypothetical protein
MIDDNVKETAKRERDEQTDKENSEKKKGGAD